MSSNNNTQSARVNAGCNTIENQLGKQNHELNSKMNNLKSSISEHAMEQVQKKSRRLCLVRVFQGGRNARQLEPVQQALAEFERKKLIDVEFIDIDTVKTQHLTVQSIVQWLLSSDVHLIITHMHQGIMELLGWNMILIIDQVMN